MRIQTGDFLTNYELSGRDEADAPVAMLSHSLASNMYMWDAQMALLEPRFRVLRYDTRGHGGSEVPPGPYTLEQLGDDAIALLDALDIRKAHWIGLSMGGMIGQSVALRYPERLASLALCDTMAVVPPEAQDAWRARIATARAKGMPALVDATMERWFTEAYRKQEPPALKLIRQYFLNTPVDGFAACAEAIRGLDYLDRLSEIGLPTLIIVGEEDTGTPVSASAAMQERIAGAKMLIIPQAAHLSNIEQATVFNQALEAFL